MKYRPEIDGLRALAVIPVILFHAGFQPFSGGFVGVDIFFVISGYLITTILVEDIENNRFSIIRFYDRRIRRILPALFFVMLGCIPMAWMWMLPDDLIVFSDSIKATILFYSNYFFWRNSGYFDPAADESPLLHTWSLAVEEQFYVLYPIFIFLAWRLGKNRLFWIILSFAVLSLALSEWGWRNKASANFYLTPTRAWELFAGSIAAFVIQKRGVQANNALSLLGLVAILFSIFAYDSSTPFPSVYALIPVSGVVLLVIFAEKETIVARLLSIKPFVGVGLISYSAYLWHQPLLAFYRYRYSSVTSVHALAILTITAVLSYMTWRFIETPYRKRSRPILATVIPAFLLLFLSAIFLQSGRPDRFPDAPYFNDEERNFYQNILSKWNACHYGLSQGVRCAHTASSSNRFDYVILGDSHAEHLFPGLASQVPDQSFIYFATYGAPFYERLTNENILKIIDGLPKPKSIIFSMNYLAMFTAIPIGSSYEDEIGKIADHFSKEGINVLLVGDVPKFNSHARQCYFDLTVRHTETKCLTSSKSNELASHQYKIDLESSSNNHKNTRLIFLDQAFCDNLKCSMLNNGKLLYRDDNHLTFLGSEIVAHRIYGALNSPN